MGHIIAEGVITGGPAAGKSTCKTAVKRWALGKPFRVIFMPEIASLIIEAGVPDVAHIYENNKQLHGDIEYVMFRMQLDVRKRALELARSFPEDTLILYDRAEMDVASYMERWQFNNILREVGRSERQVKENYDFVIHMESSAVRVPQYYGFDNPARWESAEEAVTSDERTLAAWRDHDNLYVVPGREDFEEKLHEVVQILEKEVTK